MRLLAMGQRKCSTDGETVVATLAAELAVPPRRGARTLSGAAEPPAAPRRAAPTP